MSDSTVGLPTGAREARWQTIVTGSGKENTSPLLRSAYSLAINSVLSAGLGMAFWVTAARLYPSRTLGQDSALIAAMMQLSTIAQLNLANTLVRLMPGSALARRLLVRAYLASAVVAAALGTAFVFIAPRVSDEFEFLLDEPLTAAAYVLAVVLWGVFALQDAALTAMRHAPLVPIENGLFGMLKLAGLPLFLTIGTTHGPLVAWVVPMCLLLVPVNWVLFRRIVTPERMSTSGVSSTLAFSGRRLFRFLALDYLSTVFLQTSLTVLPLLVVGILGSQANAYFYVAFAVAIATDSMCYSIAMSLVAEGALVPERVPALVRLLVRRVAVFVAPVVVVLIVAAPIVLLPFGEEYVHESTTVLRILLCASVFRAAVVLASATMRLEGSTGRIAALDGGLLLGLLAVGIPLAHVWGINGVALAWLGSSVVFGSAVTPRLVRLMRSAEAAP